MNFRYAVGTATLAIWMSFIGAVTANAFPSAERALVVYNSNYTTDEDGDGVQDSLQVANYYLEKRGVPSSNLLGVPCGTTTSYDNYLVVQAELIDPIKDKLTALGPTTIDVIVMSYGLPWMYLDGNRDLMGLDPMIQGLNYLFTATEERFSLTSNPYFEEKPMLDDDKGRFSHAEYRFNGTEMYLVGRLDGPRRLRGALDMIDQASYANRYATLEPGYYDGITYVDTDGRGGHNDLDVWAHYVAADLSGYSWGDNLMAAAERFADRLGFPLKWQVGHLIGSPNSWITFTDGTSAMTAPRAMVYGGWYAYNTYFDNVWDWLPGSVTCDLDSVSFGGSIRDPHLRSWCIQSVNQGASACSGAVTEPYLGGHPRPATLAYYMMKGFTFAEASSLANPSLHWTTLSVGDPLLAPYATKPLVRDSQIPVFSTGFPLLSITPEKSVSVAVQVNDTPEPEVVKVRIDYGLTTNYGKSMAPPGYFRRHLLRLNDLESGALHHYRVTVTDQAGNSRSSADATFTAPTQSPFGGTAWPIPGIVEAENFDLGGNGVAYFDDDESNGSPNAARNDTSVEVGGNSTAKNVNGRSPEWLEYTVNVTQSGTYQLDARLGSGNSAPGTIRFELDDVDLVGTFSVPVSFSFVTVTRKGFYLTAGRHLLRVSFPSGSIQLVDNMQFTLLNASRDASAPTVAITSPGSGATVSGSELEIVASASDNLEVAKVQFQIDGTNQGAADFSTPFSVTWNTASVPNGNHTISATAWDFTGNSSTTSISVRVSNGADTTAPVVTRIREIELTTTQATISWETDEPSDSQIEYGVTTNYGSSSSRDTTLTRSHTQAITGLRPGTFYNYRVKSQNAAGKLATSPNRAFRTLPQAGNRAPTVSFVSPADDTTFVEPAAFTLQATASDSDGSIEKVEFFQDGLLLGARTSPPFNYSVTDLPAGAHAYIARATDNNGTTVASSPLNITVRSPIDVRVTSPVEGDRLPARSDITVAATASSSPGTVTKVEFFDGTRLLGEDTTAPYSFLISDATSGNHTFRAKATNDRAQSTTSSAVQIYVEGAPSISIAFPSSTTIFNAPADIVFRANVNRRSVPLARIEFYNGSIKIGEVAPPTPPDSTVFFIWPAVPAGTYSITAKVTDTDGGSGVSSERIVTVNPRSSTLRVQLMSPVNLNEFSEPAEITMVADPFVSGANISKVEFFNGALKLGEDTTAPYSYTLSGVRPGIPTLTAKVTNSRLETATSNPVVVRVWEASDVRLISPIAGTKFSAPADVMLRVRAIPGAFPLARVELYNGTTKLTEIPAHTSIYYSYLWSGVPTGSYSITARAIDSRGGIATSSVLDVVVDPPDSILSVSLTAPVNGAVLNTGSNVTVTATATTTRGTITKVEFYNENTLLGEDTTAPYSYNWTNIPAVGSSRVDLQACKLEYSIVSPK